jgi:hypothetical protein
MSIVQVHIAALRAGHGQEGALKLGRGSLS